MADGITDVEGYGGTQPKRSRTMVPLDPNEPTTSQQLERKFTYLDAEEITHAVHPIVPQRIGGHYMQGARNKGNFAGAQLDHVNINVNISQAQGIAQKVEVTGEQEETGEMWVDLVRNMTSFKKSRESEDSDRYQKFCKKRADKYVQTTVYRQVLTKLEKAKSLLLLADPGDGKSTLLHLVTLQYGKDGFLTLRIDTPADIERYNLDDKKVLFVCDNLLGETEMNDEKRKAWKNSESQQFPDQAHFLFACRLELWVNSKAVLKRKQIFNDTVDVRSDKLTHEDKREMLDVYFGDKISESTKKLIARNSYVAFPFCCSVVSQSGDLDFTDTDTLVQTFTNPFRFVTTTLETIKKNNKLQYATLVLCVLNNRKLPITSTAGILEQPNFEDVRKTYLSDRMYSVEQLYDELLDNAKDLDGWLLTQLGDYYDFYHDSVFEAVCGVHGARYPEHILKFCKPKSVFSLCTTKKVSGSDRVFLPPRCYTKLCETVTDECVNEWKWYGSDTWRFVFVEMNIAHILKQWHKFLSESLPGSSEKSDTSVTNPTLADVLLLMSERPDKDLPVDDVFLCAAEHGNSETSKLLIDCGVTSDGRREGLYCAARKGHSEIVKMIVGQGDLDMRYIERGLREAIWSDQGECVIEIMSLQPDISDAIHNLLLEAVRYDSLSCVSELLNRNEDTNTLHNLFKKAVEWDSVKCLSELLKRYGDTHKIHDLLQKAIRRDSMGSLCELLKRDISTDTIHGLLKEAVLYGHVEAVLELVKHQAVSRDYVQTLLDTKDCELFRPGTAQTDRDKIRRYLCIMNTDF